MIPNLLFLTGEDDYRLQARVSFYREAFMKKFPNGALEEIQEGDEWDLFESNALTPSLFGEKRLFICSGFFNPDIFEQAEKSDFFEKLQEIEDFTTVIVVEPKPDKRQRWTKAFLKEAKQETFPPMETQEVIHWLYEDAQKKNIHITQNDVRHLVHRCGENLWNGVKEIEKLGHFRGSDPITKEDIDALTLPHPQQQIWDFLASLGKSNSTNALKMLTELLEQGESIYQILAMVMREVRIYAQLRYGLDQNMSESTIAKATKLHPFVVKKTLPIVRSMSLTQIESWYDTLYQIDKNIKTGGFSSTTDDTSEIELALEQFVMGM